LVVRYQQIGFTTRNNSMPPIDLLPAPDLSSAANAGNKWDRERTAFQRLLPSLMPQNAGRYVAIHEGQVVESGENQIAVALRCYERFGYVPIFVGLVSTEVPPVLRVPTPRVVGTPAP
jgi:hypothetical protein